MLFGSAVVVAIMLSTSFGSTSHRAATNSTDMTHLWLESDVRPAPMDLSAKPPLDFRSVKVCGATGLGAFLPISPDVAVGAAYTTFRLSPTERAAQIVAALRFRF
jgi:hypothetical protein